MALHELHWPIDLIFSELGFCANMGPQSSKVEEMADFFRYLNSSDDKFESERDCMMGHFYPEGVPDSAAMLLQWLKAVTTAASFRKELHA